MNDISRQEIAKVLVIRLSSLGDVILSTSGLQGLTPDSKVDWLVSSEFAPLLEGHPKIRQVWRFDRRATTILDWLRLGLKLRRQGYRQVIDLHRSLRTKVLKLLMIGTPWVTVSKPRWKRWGLFTFKKYWPRVFYPRAWVQEFSGTFLSAFRGVGAEKSPTPLRAAPDLRHLLASSITELNDRFDAREHGLKIPICVMPDSAWEGKCWPVDKFADLLEGLPNVFPVILGTRKDHRSLSLIESLQLRGVEHGSALGLSLSEVAKIISSSRLLLGNDTGLVHLAESLGVPVVVIFGPTAPSLGFRPWREQSRIVEVDLGCRPCSSDGTACYWSGSRRYACVKEVSVESVRGACLSVIQSGS